MFEVSSEVTEIQAISPPISAFDYMRDLGGLLFFLCVVASLLTYILNYNKQANTLIGKLYTRQGGRARETKAGAKSPQPRRELDPKR